MNQVNGLWERRVLSLEQYRTGANLPDADKRAIRDASDIWRVALVDNVIVPCQDILYSSLEYLQETAGHYLREQKQWLNDEWHYLGIRLCRRPTAVEKQQDFEQRRTDKRFRLFYALKWPVQMRFRGQLREREEELARIFFARADEICCGQRYRQHYFGAHVQSVQLQKPHGSFLKVPFFVRA